MSTPSKSWRSWLALGCALLFVPCLGQEPAKEQDEERGRDVPATEDEGLVEYVEVDAAALPKSNSIVTKLPIPQQRTPANVGVVASELIREQNALLMTDALTNVSSLNIQNGSGVHEFFSIRGFDSISSALLMTDGAAEPEVSMYHTYNLEGVEVFKGPAGFLYGKNPLAGAVNMVRKQPLPAGKLGHVGIMAGSFATYQAQLDTNTSSRDGSLSFRLNGVWNQSDNYRDDKFGRIRAMNPAFTWRPTERSQLAFNYELVHVEASPDSGIPLVGNEIPGVPRTRSYQSPDDFSDQEVNRFQIDWEHRLSDTVTLRNKAYYRGLDWRSDGTVFQSTFDAGPLGVLLPRSLSVLDDEQWYAGNQFEAVLSIASGPVQHELLAGLELTYESDRYTFDINSLPSVGVYSLQEFDDPFAFLFPFKSGGDVENTIIAPYVVDQMKFSRMVELLIGLRYDSIESEAELRQLGSALEPPRLVSYSRDDSKLSPMVGLTIAPNTNLTVYGNAGRSYAPPSTRLIEESDPAGLEPEQSTQFELGVKKRLLSGKLRTTIAAYQLERENIGIADPNGFTQQLGSQRSRGLEIDFAADLGRRLKLVFSYAYTDAELTEFAPCVTIAPGLCEVMDYSGNRPIIAPEHLSNFWISKTFDKWGLGGGVRYVGEQFIAEDNRFTLDRALIVNATAFYDWRSWRISLNLENLTDEDYEFRGIAGSTSVIPADPFAAYGKLEYRF